MLINLFLDDNDNKILILLNTEFKGKSKSIQSLLNIYKIIYRLLNNLLNIFDGKLELERTEMLKMWYNNKIARGQPRF